MLIKVKIVIVEELFDVNIKKSKYQNYQNQCLRIWKNICKTLWIKIGKKKYFRIKHAIIINIKLKRNKKSMKQYSNLISQSKVKINLIITI